MNSYITVGTQYQVPKKGKGRYLREILLAFQSPYCQAKKKFLQSLHSQLGSSY